MWSSKEVLLISIATGLAFCFATIYAQKKFQSYVDNRVKEKTGNPFMSMVPDMEALASTPMKNESANVHQAPRSSPRNEITYHEPPPGSGERWTPLPIS